MAHSIFFFTLPLLLIVLCLLLALSMLLPLLRQEDERRTLILRRTAACSFYCALALLGVDGVLSLLGLGWPMAPFFALCVLCLFYAGALAHFSRKFGD